MGSTAGSTRRGGRRYGPPMACRRCGAGIVFTGPPAVVSVTTGLGYLAPAVHREDGREVAADGHIATPPWDAALRAAVA